DDRVLAILGVPNAFHATIMEAAGCEAAFIGTGITGGNYTALPDTGLLSATECLQIAGYIARAVSFPLILDGDTGHGGPRRCAGSCTSASAPAWPVSASTTSPSRASAPRSRQGSRSSHARPRSSGIWRPFALETNSILTSSSWPSAMPGTP